MKQLFLRHYNLLMAGAAFVVWGCWAGYVNADSDMLQRIVSGLTQGTMSALSTLMMIWIIGFLYRWLEGARLRALLPSLVLTSALGALFVAAHEMAGTNHIARTVIPNLIIVFVFGVITTLKVQRCNG